MLKGVHFIDTSIFLSVIFRDNHEKEAVRYLAKVRNGVYEAYVSHLIIGEIAVAIRDKISLNDFSTFYGAIEKVAELLKDVKLHTPILGEYIEKLQILRGLENRVFTTDVRIVAEAATSHAANLITLDTHYNTRSVDSLINVVNLESMKL